MTTSNLPVPQRRRLEGISPRAWEHPADRAALAALQSLPGFDEVLKKVVGLLGERGVRLAFQGDAVRVSPRQFPELHRLWREVHDTLDADDEYQLFIAQSPFVNAGAVGVDKPFVVLSSGSLDLLNEREKVFVLAHELGHILSGHALYHTLLILLIQLALSGLPLVGLATTPIRLALLEWYRKSEVSGDRAGLLGVQLPDAGMHTMMKLAGGGRDEEMNLNEYLLQAEEYRHSDGVLDQVFKVLGTLGRTHPFLVLRTALLRDWIEDGSYDRIVSGDYPRRGDDTSDWKTDIGAGVRHYSVGVGNMAEKAGEAMRSAREAFERGFRGGRDDDPPPAGATP